MNLCDYCNQEEDFCSFVGSEICNCKYIHTECWYYKAKDLKSCPICKSDFYIHDCIEVYDEDSRLHSYNYYKNFLINEFIFVNNSLREEIEYFENKIVKKIIYFPDQTVEYEQLIKESEIIEEITGIVIEKKYNRDGKLISESINDSIDKYFYSLKKYDLNEKLCEEYYENIDGRTFLTYDESGKILTERTEIFGKDF